MEVSLDDNADVRVHQLLRVVETVGDPKREISVLAAKRIDPETAAGDELVVPIFYTYADEQHANVAWKDAVPLPVHDISLDDRLAEHLSGAVQRYCPPRVHAEGTLGHLLRTNGSWARGVAGRSGDVEVEVAGAFLRVTSISPTHEWTDYGFDLVVRTGGESRALRLASRRVRPEQRSP